MNHGYKSVQNIFLPKNTMNHAYKSVQNICLPNNILQFRILKHSNNLHTGTFDAILLEVLVLQSYLILY